MCLAAVSSDYKCSADVTDKQTDGCHDNGTGASDGPMQPVVRVTCCDVPSPDTDTEGMLACTRITSSIYICERLQHVGI